MIELRIHFPIIRQALDFMGRLALGGFRHRHECPPIGSRMPPHVAGDVYCAGFRCDRHECPPIGSRMPPRGVGDLYCADHGVAEVERERCESIPIDSEVATSMFLSMVHFASERTPARLADLLDTTSRFMRETASEDTKPQTVAALRVLCDQLGESAAVLRKADTADKARPVIEGIGSSFGKAWNLMCQDVVAELYPEA